MRMRFVNWDDSILKMSQSIPTQTSALYNVEGWSEGYVKINEAGHAVMTATN